MDDLSINISGLAPAAARTVAALRPRGPKRQSTLSRSPDAKHAKRGAGRSTAAQQIPGGTNTDSDELRKPRQELKPKKKPKRVESEWKSKQVQVLEAWKRTAAAQVKDPRASTEDPPPPATKQASIKRGKRAKKDAFPAGQESPLPDSKTKKPKVRSPSEGPPDSAKLKKGGIVSDTAFAALKLNESLLRQLEYLGFADCTPIQALAIPRALTGKRDVLLRAPTGSGKTLAFLLPVLHQLLVSPGGLDRRTGQQCSGQLLAVFCFFCF